MPLKHLTETVLIVLLAVVTVVMAVLTRSVPAFPAGFVPLVILTVLGLGYAAALYPILKRDRADYPFRVLHIVPALLPFITLLFGIVSMKAPVLKTALSGFVWGWMLLPVTLFFLAAVWFCLSVIRRRVPRLTFLALLFVPFAALAVVSEKQPTWNANVAMLWPKTHPVMVAQNGSSASSVLRNGQTWGERLEADLQKSKSSMPIHSSQSSRPAHLPKAGPGMDLIFLTVAAYAGTLQMRAKKRLS